MHMNMIYVYSYGNPPGLTRRMYSRHGDARINPGNVVHAVSSELACAQHRALWFVCLERKVGEQDGCSLISCIRLAFQC